MSSPGFFAGLIAKQLRRPRCHTRWTRETSESWLPSSPLSKALGEGLYELRHVGVLNTRVLFFFANGRRIIAVHGVRHKARKIPVDDLKVARARMLDWQERNRK